MAFERGVVLEDWRFAVFIPLYKGKEREQNIAIIVINLLVWLEKYMQGS